MAPARRSLMVVLAALVGSALPAAAATVSIFDHNVVVANDYSSTSHVNGSVVANNLSFSNYIDFYDNVKIAGTIKGGNGINGGSGKTFTTKTAYAGTVNNAKKVVDPTLSITPYVESLTKYSDAFAKLDTTVGTSITKSGNLLSFKYTGSATSEAVFKIDLSKNASFFSAGEIAFSLGNAASAVINVIGAGSLSLTANFNGVGDSFGSKLLWNFADATSLTLNRTFKGTVLGDGLSLTTKGGANIDGGVYVSNFAESGEVHKYLFGGPLPTLPTPSGAPPAVPLPASALGGSALLAALALRRRQG